MTNAFNPFISWENIELRLFQWVSIPNAQEIQKLLGENNANSVEIRLSPETEARAFLVKMETQMALNVKDRNEFSLSEMNGWYEIIWKLLPELKEKYEGKWWKFESWYAGGSPWTSVILYINISLK